MQGTPLKKSVVKISTPKTTENRRREGAIRAIYASPATPSPSPPATPSSGTPDSGRNAPPYSDPSALLLRNSLLGFLDAIDDEYFDQHCMELLELTKIKVNL
eukprot:sb/3478361/